MIKFGLAALAVLALAACSGGDSESGVMREIERVDTEQAQSAEDGAAFLERTRAEAGVEALPSGLLLKVVSRGSNQSLPRPSAAAQVLVHYEGKLADGSVFDSSFARNEPAQFPLQAVVPGFSEAIQHMRPGDEIVATFPMELGYGPQGRPPVIPPAAPLQFRIVLLAFQEPGGQVVNAPQ
ncbi:MAG: FKBP-type peptidyl-prolyl cis-trans isomerase [Hyphomonadaceae bacterium]|nr:FKBP-type peptidyl-prolyl cis-trans isomerase [Hyphomonadaceae bacterium]